MLFFVQKQQQMDDVQVPPFSSKLQHVIEQVFKKSIAEQQQQTTTSSNNNNEHWDDESIFEISEFNPTVFMNQLFPNKASLNKHVLDQYTQRVQHRIHQVDTQVSHLIKKQASSVQQDQVKSDLQDAKTAIDHFLLQMSTIKQHAEQAEHQVYTITKDIKSLDVAKRNITKTMTLSRQYHMLVSALDQVSFLTKKRQYKQVAQLMAAVQTLASAFDTFAADIALLQQLRQRIEQCKHQLREQLMQDFKSFDALEEVAQKEQQQHAAANTTALTWLRDACLAIDALDTHASKHQHRYEFIADYIKKKMELYRLLFPREKKDSQLDQVQKRFDWILKMIKDESEKKRIFPMYWHVSEELALEFCKVTRDEVLFLLRRYQNTIDAKDFYTSLVKCMKFERNIQLRFDMANNMDKQAAAAAAATIGYKYLGLISSCYEEFMGIYLSHSEKYVILVHNIICRTMNDQLTQLLQAEMWTDEKTSNNATTATKKQPDTTQDAAAASNSSSHGLFILITQSMNNCVGFSKGRVLYKLTDVWKKLIRRYADELMNKLPKLQASPNMVQLVNSSANATLSMIIQSSANPTNTTTTSANPKGPTPTNAPPPPAPPPSEIKSLSDLGQFMSSVLSVGQAQQQQVPLVLSSKDRKQLCYIIQTAEYCQQNIEEMESQLQQAIDDAYKQQIDFNEERNKFYRILKSAIDVLVMHTMNSMEPAWMKMVKTNWSQYDQVHDQSEYVTMIAKWMTEFIPLIVEKMPKPHFKHYCDSLILYVLIMYIY